MGFQWVCPLWQDSLRKGSNSATGLFFRLTGDEVCWVSLTGFEGPNHRGQSTHSCSPGAWPEMVPWNLAFLRGCYGQRTTEALQRPLNICQVSLLRGWGVTVLMAALSTVTRLTSNSHPQEFMWAVLGVGRRSILLLHLKKQNKQKRHSLNLGVWVNSGFTGEYMSDKVY